MPGNIVLTGFYGTGKRTAGQMLARFTDMSFISGDQLLEMHERYSNDQIPPATNELYFPRPDQALLESLTVLHNTVIAWPGCVPLDDYIRSMFGADDRFVRLEVGFDEFIDRISDNILPPGWDRTRLEDFYREMELTLPAGDPFLNTSFLSPEQVCTEIIRLLDLKPARNLNLTRSEYDFSFCRNKSSFISGYCLKKQGFTLNFPEKSGKILLITSPMCGSLYQNTVSSFLPENMPVETFVIPDGEEMKSLENLCLIYDFMARHSFSRSDTVIGLGGGVVLDMAGMAASTFKRGMKLISIPTTLLAAVDASIGGKNGVNHRLGKNLIGSFYHPVKIISDAFFLQSLPEKEFRNGMAEIVKTALLDDSDFFDFLQSNAFAVSSRDPETILEMIRRSSAVKYSIVKKDENETDGIRELLNLGHTVGHVLETSENYSGISHGEAVADGIIFEMTATEKAGFTSPGIREKTESLLRRFGFSLHRKKLPEPDVFKSILYQDKKIKSGLLHIPAVEMPGKVRVREMSCEEFMSFMDLT